MYIYGNLLDSQFNHLHENPIYSTHLIEVIAISHFNSKTKIQLNASTAVEQYFYL